MNDAFVIFIESSWLAARVRGREVTRLTHKTSPASSPEQWAAAVLAALASAGYDGAGVTLALPSRWCLACGVPIDDLPKRNRRQLMTYRLEDQLPLPVEELVVDFAIAGSNGGSQQGPATPALGVATELDRLKLMIGALEGLDIYVQSVSPGTLLAVENLLDSVKNDDAVDVVLWGTGDLAGMTCEQPMARTFELTQCRAGAIVNWMTESDLAATIIQLRHLVLVLGRPVIVCAIGLAAEELDELKTLKDVQLASPGSSFNGGSDTSANEAMDSVITDREQHCIHAAAARQAAAILSGVRRPMIEFRREKLAPPQPLRRVRTPLIAAAAMATVLGLTVAVTMMLSAQAYDGRASKYQAIERTFYREAMAGQSPLSSSIPAQLLREDRRLQALSGTFGLSALELGQAGVPPVFHRPRSALMIFSDLLHALPATVRFRVLEMQISPTDVQLDGQARTHSDADAIADGLRAAGGFAVDPPHSEVHGNNQGVSFTITARVVEPPVAVGNEQARVQP